MPAARVSPLIRSEAAPGVEAMFQRMDAMGNPPPNMHLTFGKSPALYEAWLPFATYITPSSSLPPRDRQIIILRSALAWRCGYVWSQHVVMSKRFKALSDEEIQRIGQGGFSGAWTRHDLALLAAVDETRRDGQISDGTWSVLAETYTEPQLIDAVFTIGQYALISTALRSLRVELDAGLELPAWALER